MPITISLHNRDRRRVEIEIKNRVAAKRKKPSLATWLSKVAPPAGLEPATYGLTVRRSTN